MVARTGGVEVKFWERGVFRTREVCADFKVTPQNRATSSSSQTPTMQFQDSPSNPRNSPRPTPFNTPAIDSNLVRS